jgi:hypothetical protein
VVFDALKSYLCVLTNLQYVSRTHGISSFLFIAVAVVAITVAGCRPSQQARRGDASRAGSQSSSAKMMDSLFMVQERLVTVIDTMSDVLVAQHDRIRTLEAEVARLRSLLESQSVSGGTGMTGGYYTQPTPPVATPPQSAPMPPATESYSAALRLFNDGRYEEALAAFDALAYNEPNSPYAKVFRACSRVIQVRRRPTMHSSRSALPGKSFARAPMRVLLTSSLWQVIRIANMRHGHVRV